MPLKNMLNKLGLVEDDIPVTKKKTTVSQPATPTPAAPTTHFSVSSAPAPSVDPEIQEMLNKSLQTNKLSGFDYLKFISAVDETSSTGVAEDVRFKMTGATARAMGVDKNALLKSGAHYIEVLDQDESDFNADCSQYEKTEIQSRQNRLSEIERTISDLNGKLAQLNQDHTTLTQELEEEKTALESKRSAFRVTLESIRSTIKSNIDKINQFL